MFQFRMCGISLQNFAFGLCVSLYIRYFSLIDMGFKSGFIFIFHLENVVSPFSTITLISYLPS